MLSEESKCFLWPTAATFCFRLASALLSPLVATAMCVPSANFPVFCVGIKYNAHRYEDKEGSAWLIVPKKRLNKDM